MSEPVRIAMWSGPRNISTALMRSWGNRPDTVVWDEPLYAFYLRETALAHPGAAEVIARHESDWRKVVAGLVGPVPGGKAIFYQKHMAHHFLPQVGREWLGQVAHAFLIRDPREMLTSLLKILPEPTLLDTGLPQQREIFALVAAQNGRVPPVVDAREILENPRSMLVLLCEPLGVAFDQAMLQWPPGRRATDGIWAKHWYEAVERSTTFEPYRPKDEAVPARLQGLVDDCLEIYDELHRHRIVPRPAQA
jgi:hypothetical protein